jgi:hypothetical protein
MYFFKKINGGASLYRALLIMIEKFVYKKKQKKRKSARKKGKNKGTPSLLATV